MMMDFTSPIAIFSWVSMGSILVISVLVNGFIVFVNGYLWLQNRRMVLSDILLTTLSTARCLLQFHFLTVYLLNVIFQDIYFSRYKQEFLSLSWVFLDIVSLWCNTWLSVFYCVKVTNFPNSLFLLLKTRINALTLKLFGMSIIVSMVSFVPSAITYYDQKKQCNMTSMQPMYASQSKFCKNIFTFFLPSQLCIFSVNFMMNIIASILLLTSLWRHTRNLRKSGIGVKDLSSQVHVKVIKYVMSYVFFYLIYFAGMMVYADNILNFRPIVKLAADILLSLLPLSHSIMLILINPRLKIWFARIFRQRPL